MKGHPTLRRLPKRLRRRLLLFRFRSRIWIFRHRLGLAPLCNVLIDRRYGGWSGGSRPSSHAALGANFFGSAHYYELPRIFNAGNDLEITPSDVLVDIGCGKGRVINWWLSRGADNRILGLEIEEDLAHEARERLRRYRNVTILAGNAIENLPADATIFWLFNPFTVAASGRALMEALSTRLLAMYGETSSLKIVLYRPRHVEVFQDSPSWDVRFLKDNRLCYDAAVVTRRARRSTPEAARLHRQGDQGGPVPRSPAGPAPHGHAGTAPLPDHRTLQDGRVPSAGRAYER